MGEMLRAAIMSTRSIGDIRAIRAIHSNMAIIGKHCAKKTENNY